MDRIALFGTSADPPTAAHKAILKWLSQHYDWVAVWASDNPFKLHQTSLKHRTKMLQLLIAELDTPQNNMKVYKELSDRRSLITVEKARVIWGDKVQFTLVIGSDLINQLKSWYHIEELLKAVQILVVPRPGYSINPRELEMLKDLGGKYTVADLNTPEVSSTAYREKGDRNAITQTIADYINQEQLYAC